MTYFYHAVLDSPHLPRDLQHDSTQNLVVALLGEFWSYSPDLVVPSAGIVELLKRMDVSDVAARAAMSRLARRGTLVMSRAGRTTSYSLAEDVAMTIPASETLTMTFGQQDREWNGEWTVIVFSMPETQRERRQSLREWLRWLGFGPARDGVWISPHADVSLTEAKLAGLLPDDGLIFKSSQMVGEINAFDVWPLAEIREIYAAFIEDLRPIVYRLRAGEVSPADALKIALTILARWRGFPTVDPDLPSTYLPADWPRSEARRLFVEVYDQCTSLAEIHVRNVIAKYDPACAERVRGLTVRQAIEHYKVSAEAVRQ